MQPNTRRTPPLINAKVLQMDPLTQWWTHEDEVCVALRSIDRAPIVTIGGALSRRAAGPCRLALESALRARPRRVVLDLASVTSHEISAPAILDTMRRTAAWHGAETWLTAMPTEIRRELAGMGLLPLFTLARNTTRAVEEIARLERVLPRTA